MFPELQLREGWISVICLLVMLLSVAWAIQTADWTQGLATLQGVVLLGGSLGIVLAKSRFPSRLAHLLSLLAGWTWVSYLTSQVLANATRLPPELAVAELEARFQALFFILFAEGMSADNHVFLLLLSFLLWVTAYFSAWAVFRWQRVWWAVIICGVALLVNISYTSANLTIYLILFLLFALLLVVRTNLAFYEQQWRAARVGYSPELISAVLRAGLAVTVVVIMLAWVAPEALASRPLQPIWDKIGEPWRRLQDRSSQIFQDLNYQNPAPLVSLGDRRMWFGGPVNLADTPVADVQADAGRYWRVSVFHEYAGDGWLNNDPDMVLIGASEHDLTIPSFEYRFEVTQTVTLHRLWGIGDALIAAGQPVRVSVPLRASVSFIPQEDVLSLSRDSAQLPSAPGDPSALYTREAIAQGESYQAWSLLTEVDEESLRGAGTAYPAWIVPRYLQLPDSLPSRIRLLAEQVTEGLDTPHDKARALESYLRQIPYDDQIERPAAGQDGVDYFLFEAKAGYCDYYSSAMVVMLRAVGVPARYVRGYSQGSHEDGVYHLLESDGHAWPEVFFPGYGWVEFEPTGAEPPLDRPSSREPEETDAAATQDRRAFRRGIYDVPDFEMEPDPPLSDSTLLQKPLWQRIGWPGWSALAIVLLSMVTLALLIFRRRRQIDGLSVIERVYEDLVSWVQRLLQIEPLAHQTPNEYAGLVIGHVPRGRQAVERIASLYVEERFGGKPIVDAQAEDAWQQAWPALWRRWLERRVERVSRFWWRLIPPKEGLGQ